MRSITFALGCFRTSKVVLTGNDLVDFIEIAKTVRGFGRSLKTAIADWIASNTTPYYAQKYRREIADAIRLSRFKGEDSIYAYILNAYSDVKGNSAEKLNVYQIFGWNDSVIDYMKFVLEKRRESEEVARE